MDVVQFLDLLKDPGKYEAKLKELQLNQDNLTNLIGIKSKIDEVDQYVIQKKKQADDESAKVSVDASAIKRQADVILVSAKEALDKAEQLKGANEKALSATRAKQKELVDLEADLKTKKEQLDTREKGIRQLEVEVDNNHQAVLARLQRLREAMT